MGELAYVRLIEQLRDAWGTGPSDESRQNAPCAGQLVLADAVALGVTVPSLEPSGCSTSQAIVTVALSVAVSSRETETQPWIVRPPVFGVIGDGDADAGE